MAVNTPIQLRRPPPPRPHEIPDVPAASTEDRLYSLLADGQSENAQLLRDLGKKLDHLTEACAGMAGEIRTLRVTPWLVGLLGLAVLILGGAVGVGSAVKWSESQSVTITPPKTPSAGLP